MNDSQETKIEKIKAILDEPAATLEVTEEEAETDEFILALNKVIAVLPYEAIGEVMAAWAHYHRG